MKGPEYKLCALADTVICRPKTALVEDTVKEAVVLDPERVMLETEAAEEVPTVNGFDDGATKAWLGPL